LAWASSSVSAMIAMNSGIDPTSRPVAAAALARRWVDSR
jgi:hypothetical protein